MKNLFLLISALFIVVPAKSQDGAIPKIPFLDKPYIFVAEGGDLIALEEGIFTSKLKGKKTTIYYSKQTDPGVVIAHGSEFRILIDTKNDELTGIELHRIEVLNDGRGYVLKGMGAMEQLNDRRVQINFRELDNGLLEMVPSAPLEPGHYGTAIYQQAYTFEVR